MSSIIQIKSADTIKNILKRYNHRESLIEGETEAFHERLIGQEAYVPSISDSYKDGTIEDTMVMQRTAAKLRFFFDSKRENKTDTKKKTLKNSFFKKIFVKMKLFSLLVRTT